MSKAAKKTITCAACLGTGEDWNEGYPCPRCRPVDWGAVLDAHVEKQMQAFYAAINPKNSYKPTP